MLGGPVISGRCLTCKLIVPGFLPVYFPGWLFQYEQRTLGTQ
jgi:hypothetical protein